VTARERPPDAASAAAAWLETVGAGTVATLNGSLQETIVPAMTRSTGGARALAMLADLADPSRRGALQLGDVIGEGGMGVVHEAEQVALGRTVAVKTLRPGPREPAAALDLLREAWVTGALEHPNVVPVHYLGVDDAGMPSIVLKRVQGTEWSKLLADASEVERRFGATDLLAWNFQILFHVLNAVRFAHSHGIIHRDLKPSNVMVGDFGEVYLLDWGIAVSLHDDGTGRFPLAIHASDLAGTPSYMAPEMLGRGGAPLSIRTDVYLAGAVLYELVTGKPPHAGSNVLAVITSVLASRPELPAHVPPELARICTRAMDDDPTRRYESIDALRTALAHYLEHRGSAQLAERARERLDQLLDQLGPSASGAGRQREDIYRLFGACRYGFRDALAVWPDNEDARAGLVQAVVAVAEYELAGDRPAAAVSLLGELDDPPPLLATARAAAIRHAELERIGRDHDVAVGTRMRTSLTMTVGLAFTVCPLVIANVPQFREASHAFHASFAAVMLVIIAGLALASRRTVTAMGVNRRLIAALGFLFVVQGVMALGGWLAGTPAPNLFVWDIALYATMSGMGAIMFDPWTWGSTFGYLVAFLYASHNPSHALYAMSASNVILAASAALRGRMLTRHLR